MPNQIHVGTAIYCMQPILAHKLVHHIYNVEEMGTDRYANGAVEKCLPLGKKLADGALTLTICIFIKHLLPKPLL